MNMLIKNRLNQFPVFGNYSTNNFLKEIDNFASELFSNMKTEGFCPAFDIEESENSLMITAELPGMELSDIEVTLQENTVTISGEKKSENKEENKEYHFSERSFGKFERTFELGENIDLENVNAIMKNGVLKINFKKAEKAEKTPKKIEVKVG